MTGVLRAGAGGSGGSGIAALASPLSFSSPRRRRERDSGGRQKQVAQPGNRENSFNNLRPGQKPDSIGDQVPLADSGLCNAEKEPSFSVSCRSPQPFRGRALEASILPLEVSGLSPSLHLRLSGWRAAAAPRPNSLSEGNINWYGRSGLAPSGTFIWRSTSPTARRWQ